jgi:hypothetical protein
MSDVRDKLGVGCEAQNGRRITGASCVPKNEPHIQGFPNVTLQLYLHLHIAFCCTFMSFILKTVCSNVSYGTFRNFRLHIKPRKPKTRRSGAPAR